MEASPKMRLLEHFVRDPFPLLAVLERSWPPYEPFQPPEGVALGLKARAELNHGRWIVRCLFCPGANLACWIDQRFFCVDCFHRSEPRAVGRWLLVEWPDELEAIESLIAKRPEPNRSWQVGETLENLEQENAEHGIRSN